MSINKTNMNDFFFFITYLIYLRPYCFLYQTLALPCLVLFFVFFWTCLVLLIVWNVLFLLVSWMHVKVKLLVGMQHADRMIVVNNNNIKVIFFYFWGEKWNNIKVCVRWKLHTQQSALQMVNSTCEAHIKAL